MFLHCRICTHTSQNLSEDTNYIRYTKYNIILYSYYIRCVCCLHVECVVTSLLLPMEHSKSPAKGCWMRNALHAMIDAIVFLGLSLSQQSRFALKEMARDGNTCKLVQKSKAMRAQSTIEVAQSITLFHSSPFAEAAHDTVNPQDPARYLRPAGVLEPCGNVYQQFKQDHRFCFVFVFALDMPETS